MATSLASQLQKLAAPQTDVFLQKDKKRLSLLFDPKEAANFDKETFFDIGSSGIQELEKVNPVFSEYMTTIFSQKSLNFERSIHDSIANKNLSKVIKKFFIHLSPYFLMKCAHKALEWLVYQYRIHEYNKDELMLLILPYHETNIFVRVVQLLNLKNEHDKWHWLKPLQKAGVHLDKQSLFCQCSINQHLFNFICQMPVIAGNIAHGYLSSLTALHSFCCTTLIGTIEYMSKITDDHVSHISVMLHAGLISTVPDFSAACMMVLAEVTQKAQLGAKFLNACIKKIIIGNRKILKKERTVLLVLICESQKEQFHSLEPAIVKEMAKSEWFKRELLSLLSSDVNALSLVRLTANSIIKIMQEEHDTEHLESYLIDLFTKVQFPNQNLLCEAMFMLLDVDTTKGMTYLAKIYNMLETILEMFERMYPTYYDFAVKAIETDKSKYECLKKILARKSDLGFLKMIHHANSAMRINALKKAAVKFDDFLLADPELLRFAVKERLSEQDPLVVRAALQLPPKNLVKLFGETEYLNLMLDILITAVTEKGKWKKVIEIVIPKVFDSDFSSSTKMFFVAVLYVFPLDDSEIWATKLFLSQKYAINCDFFSIRDELCDCDTAGKMCDITWAHIWYGQRLLSLCELLSLRDNLEQINRNEGLKFLYIVFLVAATPKNCDFECCLKISEELLATLKLTTLSLLENENVNIMQVSLRSGFFGSLPIQGVAFCLNQLFDRTQPPKLGKWLDFTFPSKDTMFLMEIFTSLLMNCCVQKKAKLFVYRTLFKAFLNKYFDNVEARIEFCCNFAIAHDRFDECIRISCVKIIQALLGEDRQLMLKLSGDDSVLIPALLTVLCDPQPQIRQAGFELICYIADMTESSDTTTYLLLVSRIQRYKNEILLDADQFPLVLYLIISEVETASDALAQLTKEVSKITTPIHVAASLMNLLAFNSSIPTMNATSDLGMRLIKDNNNFATNQYSSVVLRRMVLQINDKIAANLSLNDNAWLFIENALRCDTIRVTHEEEKDKQMSLSSFVLSQISPEVFSSFSSEIQSRIIKAVVDVVTATEDSQICLLASSFVKKIVIDANSILDLLNEMKDAKSNKQPPPSKGRLARVVVPTLDILDKLEWKKGITILEFIQDKKKLTHTEVLLPVLFDILKKCLDFVEQSTLEYPKQLVLSIILHCCSKISDFQRSAFNVELVVQCIRASQNPQTHHHALLLLAQVAAIVPEEVLHHTIAIFTFMGSSVLRHDDAYSFQIIAKIIDSVVPILVKTDKANSGAVKQTVVSVLRVFVDAILDIPEHRRLMLFEKLLNTLDAKKYLWVLMMLVFEAHVMHHFDEKQNLENREKVPKRLDMLTEILLCYEPKVLTESCLTVIDCLKCLPAENNDAREPVPINKVPFSLEKYTPKQFRHFKYTIVTFLSEFLSSQQLVTKIACLGDDNLVELEAFYKDLIINVLTFIRATSKNSEKNASGAHAQYWKAMLHRTYDILDSINALLTNRMFLLVIRGLMSHDILTVKRKAIELLVAKLQANAFSKTDRGEMLALLPPLLAVIKDIGGSDIEPDNELIQQTALLSIKLLSKHLAADNAEKFKQVLDFTTELMRRDSLEGNILASVVLCAGELCANLKAQAIPNLSSIMPVLIKLLKKCRLMETPDLILLSIVIAIQKVIDTLPMFLSSYMEKLLVEFSILLAKWGVDSDQKVTNLVHKLRSNQQKISTTIPSRVLIPSARSAFQTLLKKKNLKAIGPLMRTLVEHLSSIRSSETTVFLPELTTFLLEGLQYRADNFETVDLETINTVEDHVIDVLVALVLKLSETTFRPLYYKLYDWAIREDEEMSKVVTFYRLSAKISKSLKSLFVLFAGHFIKHAADTLDAFNSAKKKDTFFTDDATAVLLVDAVLMTLRNVFTYDSQNFVSKERFDTLMQPLVDQLENNLGGDEKTNSRSRELLIPCVAQFAVATANDALWKQLNYQVLLKTRHSSATVRLLALSCLCEVVHKLGEDFLPLLPETIPFIAELLEDEDETVEKACQKAVQDLEQVLGEPIQKYF